MLNWIFLLLIASSVVVAAFTGKMPEVTKESMAAAKTSVELAIGLIGQMAMWLGFMGVLREAGLMRSIARSMAPVMKRLFPDVPPDHPAMGAMIMNLAANILGLGNAATPFGLKAMAELNKLNKHPGVATNAMVLFLAINTSGVAVLPLGAVAWRATLGSKDAAGIVLPTILSTACSTITAIIVAKLLAHRKKYAPERFVDPNAVATLEAAKTPEAAMAEAEEAARPVAGATGWRLWALLALTATMLVALGMHAYRMHSSGTAGSFDIVRGIMSDWLLPFLMLAVVAFGFGRNIKVYEVFVRAAKEGFQISITIIPFLVAILVAIAMFRASGAMDALIGALQPVTSLIGFPAEALPMALLRPLSGSGAMGVMTATMEKYGPDSFVGYLVSVINGSMETTFYVLAVYFGSIQIRAVRHTIPACLAADLAGVAAALFWCRVFFT